MKTVRLLSAILCYLALTWPTHAADANIRFISIAEVETVSVNAAGEEIIVREPAVLVVPDTIVIYTNRFINEDQIPAENLVVTNPVPENMVYVAGSAEGNDTVITYSVDDGQSFAAEDQLIVTGPDGQQRPARPEDITHIRWRLTTPLLPGESGEVVFRAQLL